MQPQTASGVQKDIYQSEASMLAKWSFDSEGLKRVVKHSKYLSMNEIHVLEKQVIGNNSLNHTATKLRHWMQNHHHITYYKFYALHADD